MAQKRQRVYTNTDHEMSSSQSVYETVGGSHEYKIKGYSLAKGMGVGKYMTSDKFTVGGHEWVLRFNPDGFTEDYKEYVSVYLELLCPGQEEVRALFSLKLLDQCGKNNYGTVPNQPTTFNKGISIWGLSNFMKRSEFETTSYLKDDCLSILCTIGVLKNHVETMQPRVHKGKDYFIPVPPSNMISDLKGMLESGIRSDVTFQVGNKSFKAHKSVLATRCPVFRAQFLGSVGNPDIETVAIEEFDPFAFKAMLLFLYSDEIPDPSELSDLDPHCTSTTIIQHLLVAADRFVLERLKLMCESKLCEEITADTLANTLALAHDHQCLQLKTACLNFAAEPENMGEVAKSDGFAQLEKSNPSLFIELLKTSWLVNAK